MTRKARYYFDFVLMFIAIVAAAGVILMGGGHVDPLAYWIHP